MSDLHDPFARLLGPQTYQNRERRVPAVVTARVERIEDDGTYRLRFFGLNVEEGEDDTSARARVMTPMAGDRRGVHFFPEVGDEVVVGFHDGDTNAPIVLGALWNRSSPPPPQAKPSARNDVRAIVSRSGHEVTLDDTPGSEKVTIRSQGGHEIVLDDAPAGRRVTVSSRGGRRITIDDTPPGGVVIESPGGRISLADGGRVSIQGAVIDLDAPVLRINGQPYMLHKHILAPNAVTGPVSPL